MKAAAPSMLDSRTDRTTAISMKMRPARQKFLRFSLPFPNAQMKYMMMLTQGMANMIRVMSQEPTDMTS